MTAGWLLAAVLAVLFFATFVRSTFGFGEALLAVPLLSLAMPVDVAAPVAVLVSITVSIVALTRDWRHVHARSAARLVLATLVGTPLGLLLLTHAPEAVVKAILGVLIAVFSLYLLLGRKTVALKDDRSAWGFGFAAGVLGGAYGMNGPPLVIYGTLRGWSPQHFRATLQGYFLPASVMALIGYAVAGLWTPEVTHYFLLSLPVVIAGIVAGRSANRKMNPRLFLRCVHIGLIAVGCALLAQALRAG